MNNSYIKSYNQMFHKCHILIKLLKYRQFNFMAPYQIWKMYNL